MKAYRMELGFTLDQMSRIANVSSLLLGMVENGAVTHPNIAKRIANAYHLTEEECTFLVPRIHRVNDPQYEPDKYKIPDDYWERGFSLYHEPCDEYTKYNYEKSYAWKGR